MTDQEKWFDDALGLATGRVMVVLVTNSVAAYVALEDSLSVIDLQCVLNRWSSDSVQLEECARNRATAFWAPTVIKYISILQVNAQLVKPAKQ